MSKILLSLGFMFIAGFIFGVIVFYFKFRSGSLIIVDDGEDPYTFMELEVPLEKIYSNKAIILDIKKQNFIDMRYITKESRQ